MTAPNWLATPIPPPPFLWYDDNGDQEQNDVDEDGEEEEEENTDEYIDFFNQVPDTILMLLDMDLGTLSFMVDDR